MREKIKSLFLVCFAIIVFLQWLHYTLYFNQPILISGIWSIVDWSIWSGLFVSLMYLCEKHHAHHKWLLIGFVILAGIMQILIASVCFQLLLGSDKSFLVSVTQSINKRWLQYLMISLILAFVAERLLTRRSGNLDLNLSPKAESEPDIHLDDGKTHYYLKQKEIAAIVANRNYVSIFTDQKEIVIRSTLKALIEQLDKSLLIQISRSSYINQRYVTALSKYSRTSYQVTLKNQQTLNVSKAFLNSLRLVLHSD